MYQLFILPSKDFFPQYPMWFQAHIMTLCPAIIKIWTWLQRYQLFIHFSMVQCYVKFGCHLKKKALLDYNVIAYRGTSRGGWSCSNWCFWCFLHTHIPHRRAHWWVERTVPIVLFLCTFPSFLFFTFLPYHFFIRFFCIQLHEIMFPIHNLEETRLYPLQCNSTPSKKPHKKNCTF